MPSRVILLPLTGLPLVVQRVGDPADDVGGHRRVDLAGQLDEPGVQAVLPGHPGQVERVDRDAVPAQPGPGIERLEAERLGLGRVDHFPDVDAHAVVEHLQLVDQGDVDGAVGVLQDLAGLGDLRRRRPGRPGRRPRRTSAAASSRLRPSRPPTTLGIVGAEKSGCPGPRARG